MTASPTKVTFPEFPNLTFNTSSGPVSVICEPIGTHFAITPEFYMTDDRQALLDGTFLVSLYPSGIRLSVGAGCIRCARRAALEWAKLPLDWPAMTYDNHKEWAAAQPTEALETFVRDRDLAFNCATGYCEQADDDDRSHGMGDTVDVYLAEDEEDDGSGD